jgi:hypothetical protein
VRPNINAVGQFHAFVFLRRAVRDTQAVEVSKDRGRTFGIGLKLPPFFSDPALVCFRARSIRSVPSAALNPSARLATDANAEAMIARGVRPSRCITFSMRKRFGMEHNSARSISWAAHIGCA